MPMKMLPKDAKVSLHGEAGVMVLTVQATLRSQNEAQQLAAVINDIGASLPTKKERAARKDKGQQRAAAPRPPRRAPDGAPALPLASQETK